MITKSSEHNPNYLAEVVLLQESDFAPHPNADRLKLAYVNFEPVIVHVNTKAGLYIFFPAESQISPEILSYLNAFRDSSLNEDQEAKGFFDKNGRVRAQKIRGEYSLGFLIPAEKIVSFAKDKLQMDLVLKKGQSFDAIGEYIALKKYEPVLGHQSARAQGKSSKKGVFETDRIIPEQVRLHFDTKHFAKPENYRKMLPDTIITITEKIHGTSFSVGNLLVKKKKSWWQKLIPFWNPKEHGIVYASRRVVRNDSYKKDKPQKGFYSGYDNYADYANKLAPLLPKGFTVYGEAVGYYSTGKKIQPPYNYGCKLKEFELYIYRVTFTGADNHVVELTSKEAKKFCEQRGLNFVPILYLGSAQDLVPLDDLSLAPIDDVSVEEWRRHFVSKLAEMFLEKDCQFHIGSGLPAEGICIRLEEQEGDNIYKMKSKRFLELETEQLDKQSKGQV